MPRLSHDTAEDGFHEIQLSGKQLVFLFIVDDGRLGRHLPVRRARRPWRASGAWATSRAAVSAAGPSATTPQPGAGRPPAAEPPAAPETDELSYRKRLEGDDRLARSSSRRRTVPTPRQRTPKPPRPSSATKPAPPQAGSRDRTAAAPTPRRRDAPASWVVQVVALQDRAAATSLVKRLNGKGYPAFLVTPPPAASAHVQGAGRPLQRPARGGADRRQAREGRAVQALDFALALLSGALLALSFPKFGHPAFAWLALTPLVVAAGPSPAARATGRTRSSSA